jgi:RNA polymerase sigma factor (sigma-70 family)
MDYARKNRELFRAYLPTRSDLNIRNEIAWVNSPLVKRIASQCCVGQRTNLYGYGDFYQIASLKLLDLIDVFDPDNGCPFASYVYKHLSGEIRHFIRDGMDVMRSPREGARTVVYSTDTLSGSIDFPDREIQDSHRSVEIAVGELPERDRQIVELIYFQGWTYKQVATHMGCSPVTVSRRLKDIHANLRQSLDGCLA